MITFYGTKKAKVVKTAEIRIDLPEEPPQIGQKAEFKVVINPKEDYHLDYILFELVNERTDKRAPYDRVTSRSRYLSRHNVDADMNTDEDNEYTLGLRVPVHKEPSRNDKFICIKWELSIQIYVKKSGEDKDELLCIEGATVEMEVE